MFITCGGSFACSIPRCGMEFDRVALLLCVSCASSEWLPHQEHDSKQDVTSGLDAAMDGATDAFAGDNSAGNDDEVAGGGDGGNCPVASFVYMDDCACPDQCVSGLCAAAGSGDAQVCTRACTSSSDCPERDICTTWIVDGVSLCAANDTGTSCVDQTTCNAHACLFRPDKVAGGICTVYCDNATKCPEGYGCLHSTFEPDLEFCAPLGSACPGGASQCYSAACLVSGSTGEQYCTGDCTEQADCPAGYVCDALAIGSTRTVCKN